MRSSSFHRFNADRHNSPRFNKVWFAANRVVNRLGASSGALAETLLTGPPTDAEWARMDPQYSPARALSNLYWMRVPWADDAARLGSLNLFDIGCGDGRYALDFQTWAGGCIAFYRGEDLHPRPLWEEISRKHPWCSFAQTDSANLNGELPENITMVVSQSALEHFEEDVTFMRGLHRFVRRMNRSFLQIHMVPAARSLDLYGTHGVRQYSPGVVARLLQVFKADSHITLTGLGGNACATLHVEVITRAQIERRPDTRGTPEYFSRLREAITEDMLAAESGQAGPPIFYAIRVFTPAS